MSDYRRPLPESDRETAFYWEAAAAGHLAILRCQGCRHYIHYPKSPCPACGGTDLTPSPVSGRGVIHSFTLTHYVSAPGFDDAIPFVVALVELEEQAGLRIVANLRNCRADQVAVGMPVTAIFERVTGDVTLPQFRPA